jgi:Flp pilus assembly protein TadG
LSIGNGRRGQALVEFALIVPVLMLILVIAIDFGRLFFSYIEVSNAAREGANYAAAHAADSPFDAATYTTGVTAAALGETNAQAQRGEGGLQVVGFTVLSCFNPTAPATPINCSTATNSGGIGDQVSVSVRQPFTFFTPLIGGFFGGQLNISSSATAPILNPVITGLVIPSPSAGASQAPGKCLVPNYYHTTWAAPGSTDTWHAAGFTGMLTNATGGHKIQSQTLTQGTSVLCTSNMTVSN